MRTHRAAVWSAVLGLALLAGFGRAQGPESFRQAGEQAWQQAGTAGPALKFDAQPLMRRPRGKPARPPRKLFHVPILTPVSPRVAGPLIGSFRLADRLDVHRSLLTRQLGALPWDISMAADSKFKVQYLAFWRKPALGLKRIDDLNRLRGEGVVAQIDANTAYRFKVSINIFSPVRGSTLNIDPVNGTRGPSHKIKTGEILDQVKAHSFVFRAGGKEFWLAYGTDVDPKTDQLATTSSLLFVNEAGLDSKAWPVPEDNLAVDQPTAVALGDTHITLVRASDGTLRIHGK